MKIDFRDGTTSESYHVGLINTNSIKSEEKLEAVWSGAIKTAHALMICIKDNTHIGLHTEYGDANSTIRIYPISEITCIHV